MAVTDKDCEYVVDERSIEPGTYDITEYAPAKQAIVDYLRARLEAVLERWPGRPVLMLSGGVDSILIAAVLAQLRTDVLAVTFSQDSSPQAAEETRVAREVAHALGFEHHVVAPRGEALEALLKETVERLDSAEPWEVLSGAILVAVDKLRQEHGADGALITGAGADALFLGGKTIDTTAEDYLQQWDAQVRRGIKANFTRERFIPDFYERLIAEPQRHIQVWQTHEAVDLALRIHPRVTRGADLAQDKTLFRHIAADLGINPELVQTTKNPMQVSSGGLEAIVTLAREQLARRAGEKTYSDPMEEPLEFTVARLFLAQLEDQTRGE